MYKYTSLQKPGAVQSRDCPVFSLQSNMAAQGLTVEVHEERGWCFGEKSGDQLGSWDQLGKLKWGRESAPLQIGTENKYICKNEQRIWMFTSGKQWWLKVRWVSFEQILPYALEGLPVIEGDMIRERRGKEKNKGFHLALQPSYFSFLLLACNTWGDPFCYYNKTLELANLNKTKKELYLLPWCSRLPSLASHGLWVHGEASWQSVWWRKLFTSW